MLVSSGRERGRVSHGRAILKLPCISVSLLHLGSRPTPRGRVVLRPLIVSPLCCVLVTHTLSPRKVEHSIQAALP